MRQIPGKDLLLLPVRLESDPGWSILIRPLADTHQAIDDQMGCADLEICVNGVTRAIEYVERANLMSDGQDRLHV
jgi:hypothetical protein